MDVREWLQGVPEEITGDPLWRMQVYRMALFAADQGWEDVTLLAADRRTLSPADQLYRALGSMGANIAEGYSRGTGKDRARFYEYALGSAREARDWYYKARHVLGPERTQERLDLTARIVRQMLTIIPAERGSSVREEPAPYEASPVTDADWS